jgi:hypothetical protein
MICKKKLTSYDFTLSVVNKFLLANEVLFCKYQGKRVIQNNVEILLLFIKLKYKGLKHLKKQMRFY